MHGHRIEGSVLLSKRLARHRFRESILEGWGRCCAYCGAAADTLDHVRARARGGETRTANLVAACAPCNRAKASADWLAWFRAQSGWSAAREARVREWVSGEAQEALGPLLAA
jgi:5-methylcytosine-specific restriction endonuclease McrA